MTPPNGPLNPRWGPFIRNAQPLGKDMFLVEMQRGIKGTGKLWRMAVVMRHPEAGFRNQYTGQLQPDWLEIGSTKPAGSKHRQGQWAGRLYRHEPIWNNHYVEGYFPTEERAVRFMTENVLTFMED